MGKKTKKIGDIILSESDKLTAKKDYNYNFRQILTKDNTYVCSIKNGKFGVICDNENFIELEISYEIFDSLFYCKRIKLNKKLNKVLDS